MSQETKGNIIRCIWFCISIGIAVGAVCSLGFYYIVKNYNSSPYISMQGQLIYGLISVIGLTSLAGFVHIVKTVVNENINESKIGLRLIMICITIIVAVAIVYLSVSVYPIMAIPA